MQIAYFVVEDGVPFPPPHRTRDCGIGPPLKHPWDRLQVGNSMMVPTLSTVTNALNWARKHGRRFISEKQDDPRGYRIWRVE